MADLIGNLFLYLAVAVAVAGIGAGATYGLWRYIAGGP